MAYWGIEIPFMGRVNVLKYEVNKIEFLYRVWKEGLI